MARKRYLLCLEDERYEVRGRRLRRIGSVQDLRGDKMVFTDFEGSVPQVATSEARGRYAHAVIEKELREAGDIEAGGRLFPLLLRRRGQRTTELLYIAAPPPGGVEKDVERDHHDSDYLLFPVQRLLSDALVRLKPRRPVAVLLIRDGWIDVLVGDRRMLYGAFGVSTAGSGADAQRTTRSMENALRAIERDNNIEVRRLQCLKLLVRADADLGWLDELARERRARCVTPRAARVRVDGGKYESSELKQLLRMSPDRSCSPRSEIIDYRANAALPWAAAAMLALCGTALWFLVDRHTTAAQLESRIAALSSSIDASVAGAPAAKPEYQVYLDTAANLAYARSIPGLREVLGNILGAARDRRTALKELTVKYDQDHVLLTISGETDKTTGDDGMAHYHRFVAELRRRGYALYGSELDTGPRRIAFSMQLRRPIAGEQA